MLHLFLTKRNLHKTPHHLLDLRIRQQPIILRHDTATPISSSNGQFEIRAKDLLRSSQIGFLAFPGRQSNTGGPVETIANSSVIRMFI